MAPGPRPGNPSRPRRNPRPHRRRGQPAPILPRRGSPGRHRRRPGSPARGPSEPRSSPTAPGPPSPNPPSPTSRWPAWSPTAGRPIRPGRDSPTAEPPPGGHSRRRRRRFRPPPRSPGPTAPSPDRKGPRGRSRPPADRRRCGPRRNPRPPVPPRRRPHRVWIPAAEGLPIPAHAAGPGAVHAVRAVRAPPDPRVGRGAVYRGVAGGTDAGRPTSGRIWRQQPAAPVELSRRGSPGGDHSRMAGAGPRPQRRADLHRQHPRPRSLGPRPPRTTDLVHRHRLQRLRLRRESGRRLGPLRQPDRAPVPARAGRATAPEPRRHRPGSLPDPGGVEVPGERHQRLALPARHHLQR